MGKLEERKDRKQWISENGKKKGQETINMGKWEEKRIGNNEYGKMGRKKNRKQ